MAVHERACHAPHRIAEEVVLIRCLAAGERGSARIPREPEELDAVEPGESGGLQVALHVIVGRAGDVGLGR